MVTNLKDSGVGSLRYAVANTYNDTIRFAVSGTIELNSEITISHANLVIDGSSAPNGGICLKNYGIKLDAAGCTIKYLRIRPGVDSGEVIDSMYLTENADNTLIEHCSFSWSIDENFQVLASDVEVRYCIFSEALVNTYHPDGGHSKNAWWCYGANRVNFHHNLLAHAEDRNITTTCGDCEVVNNVLYNVLLPTQIAPIESAVKINFIGNIMVDGVDTWRNYDPSYRPMFRVSHNYPLIPESQVYVENNICGDRPTDDLPETDCIDPDELYFCVDEKIVFDFGVTPDDVNVAYADVLANAGATLPKRDSVDTRIVNDVINQTGSVIDNPSEVGGYPDLTI